MEQENAELKQTIKQLKSQITVLMKQIRVNCLNEGIPADPVSDDIELTDLDSDAIYSIKTNNDVVSITYRSNSKKEYYYKCNDINAFKVNIRYPDMAFSYGRYVNKCIKNVTLTPI